MFAPACARSPWRLCCVAPMHFAPLRGCRDRLLIRHGTFWGPLMIRFLLSVVLLWTVRPVGAAEYDVLIRGGTVYDGSGAPGKRADVGLRGDAIAALGDLSRDTAKLVVDARGLAVAPGFINMLSWSVESFLADGRGQSEIRQGVTTQIMGEGHSWGPVNDAIRKRMKAEQSHIKY